MPILGERHLRRELDEYAGTTTGTDPTGPSKCDHRDPGTASPRHQPDGSAAEPSSAACSTTTSQPHRKRSSDAVAEFWHPIRATSDRASSYEGKLNEPV
jgi:hypothetical protein